MPGAGSQGLGESHPTAWTGEKGRETQGREARGGTKCREGTGEVLNPAPSTWPFTRAAPAQEASGVLIWGGRASAAPPPPLHILFSPLITPCHPLPSAQLRGQCYPLRRGSCDPKYRHLAQDSEQGLELPGLG